MASTQRRQCPAERRPQMLKDFLLRDDFNSCSSTGFNSFPRFPSSNAPDSKGLQQSHPASSTLGAIPLAPKSQRTRSPSWAAAEAAVSALQKLLKAVKSRSTKKQSNKKKKNAEIVVQVRVKDILRWTSLRDLIDGLDEEENTQLLDCIFSSPGVRSRLDGRVGPASGIGGQSLFNAEEEGGKGNVGGEDPMMTATGTALCSDHGGPPKGEDFPNENHEEQQSPVSILDSPFRDDADSVSSFDHKFADVERTKERLLESIKWFESLAGVKPSTDEDDSDLAEEPTVEEEEEPECTARHAKGTITAQPASNVNHLHSDAFKDEQKTKSCFHKDEKAAAQIVKEAEAYLSRRGTCIHSREFEGIDELEECVEDVEKKAQWIKFEEQLAFELEIGVLNALLDELLFNLVARSDGLY